MEFVGGNDRHEHLECGESDLQSHKSECVRWCITKEGLSPILYGFLFGTATSRAFAPKRPRGSITYLVNCNVNWFIYVFFLSQHIDNSK